MRTVLTALTALTLTAPASAQVASPPTGLATLELERSRTCVGVIARVERLDEALAPHAQRAQRLLGISEAIALEDDRVVEQLDTSDPVEAQVQAWFTADQELAQRYVATLAQELVDERTTAREAIKEAVASAIASVEAEANGLIAEAGDLAAEAGQCDGAILVRSAVLEACATATGAVCEEAALEPSQATRFRFVESPEAVWDVTEVRPWTDPTPLLVTPQGQLDGARTIGYARTGNVVVSVAFSPLIKDRAEMTPEEVEGFGTTNAALGLESTHPDVAFAPALGLRATLPRPLADESRYLLHFGPVEDPDVLWTGTPGSGAAIESTVPLGAPHVQRLRAGEAITFTALRGTAPEATPVFTIEIASVNQARASTALLAYMADQLGRDLAQIVPPRGSG